jgi:hypothetical protein
LTLTGPVDTFREQSARFERGGTTINNQFKALGEFLTESPATAGNPLNLIRVIPAEGSGANSGIYFGQGRFARPFLIYADITQRTTDGNHA